jgi:hypothetical protein
MTIMMKKIATIMGLCLTALSVMAQEKPMQVFVLAGQSNMYGMGDPKELPDDLKGEQEGVLFFNGKDWLPLAPGACQHGDMGPELSFAKEMSSKLDKPIGIVKYGVGGTNLGKDWSPDDPRSRYGALVKAVTAAQKSRPIEIVGMLWMQGESDARVQELANAYAANLSHLILCARNDFNSPDMIFVAGRENHQAPFTDIVRNAQEKCDLPRYAFIDCDKLSKKKDNLHYDTNGQVDMGRGFARTMLELMKAKE